MAVMAQWQSTGGSSQCPGLDSRRLTAFLFFSILPHNIYFQYEARCSEHS